MSDSLIPVLTRLLDYAEARLDADSPAGGVRSSAFVAGGQIVWDECCADGAGEGQLRLRVAGTYPTRSFPSPASADEPCPHRTAVEIELSVMRCSATVDDRGVAPSASTLTAEAVKVHGDRFAIMEAFACDWRGEGTPDEDRPFANLRWTPASGGGCVGGSLTATVEIRECFCR